MHVVGEDGKPKHSWRILLLPFLEQEGLYKTYDIAEPWDGPTNRKLAAKMPDVYRSRYTPEGRNATCYLAIVKPNAHWFVDLHSGDYLDPLAYPPLLIEANPYDVNWMEPRDLTEEEAIEILSTPRLDRHSGHKYLETFFYEYYSRGRHIVLADGSIRWIKGRVPRDVAVELVAGGGRIPLTEAHRDVPDEYARRLRIERCVPLAAFALLMFLPLPWVWIRPRPQAVSSPTR